MTKEEHLCQGDTCVPSSGLKIPEMYHVKRSKTESTTVICRLDIG